MADSIKTASGTLAIADFNRERLRRIADWLAVALAVSLPWSTSATGILAGLWLIVLVPTLEVAGLRRELLTPAGGLPVLLWAFGVVGMLWADVPMSDRLHGLGSFHKLLVIPLLIFHFRRSVAGAWVMKGFLLSCGALLVCSWVTLYFPSVYLAQRGMHGVPVKDYISQSAMFTICIGIAMELAMQAWRNSRADIAIALVLLALVFFANILFVATSRTALVVVPVILLLFGLKRFSWTGTIKLLAAMVVAAAIAWPFSSYLQYRVGTILEELRAYSTEDTRTSTGERVEFWKKSIEFIRNAPVIGHGTGTITEQFRRVAKEGTGASALVSSNPHNQTFAVAIQLGLVGAAILFAMWIAHLLLFRGGGSASWIGLAVVVQNIVGSLFNSHLFDSTHGWGYVIGVGIAGGVVCAANARASDANATGTAIRKRDKVDVP